MISRTFGLARAARRLGGIVLTLVVLLSSGCAVPGPRSAPQERARLEQRAMKLLLRAAQSELDIARANALEALVDVAPDESRLVFRAAVASDIPVVRYAGCVALGDVRDRTSTTALRRLMTDPDPHIRLAAAYSAYRCGNTNAGRILADTMAEHPDEKLRAEAAYLIGKLGEARAMKRLKRAADREDSNYVLAHIDSALAMLGDKAATDKLIQYALKSDAVTIVLALQTLMELAPETARETFEYRLHNDSDYLQMRLIAARGLGRLGTDEGYDLAHKSLRYHAVDDNETMQVRVNAALALGAIGQDRALPALERLADGESDPRTQVAACYAICQIIRASSTSP